MSRSSRTAHHSPVAQSSRRSPRAQSRGRTATGLGLALALAGCGYTFSAGGARLPDRLRTVCAPLFQNRTGESGLELVFTQSLRERLTLLGVHQSEGCEGRITGEILNVWGGHSVLTATNPPQLASYRLFATVKLRLYRGDKLLTETDVTGAEDYLPSRETFGDVLHVEANRQAALRRLAESVVRDGYDRLAMAW